MKYLFLPALPMASTRWDPPTGYRSNQYRGPEPDKEPSRFDQLRLLNWVDEREPPLGAEGPAFYRHYLMSYYSFRDRKFELPPNGYRFADSGGFSVVRFGLSPRTGPKFGRRLDPVDILRWQASHAEAGVILDLPPVKGPSFETALAKTVDLARRARPVYEEMLALGTRFRWWGIAHGWTDAQTTEWWARVSDVYPFTGEGEGWAVRARLKPESRVSWDPIAIAKTLRWIQARGIRRAHFLAAGVPVAMSVILTLGPEAGLEFATSDSGSGIANAANRHLILQGRSAFPLVTERDESDVARRYIMERCNCTSCVDAHNDVVQYPWLGHGSFNEYWKFRFLYHNTLVQVRAALDLTEEAKTDPHAMMKDVLGAETYYAVLRTFEGREAIPAVTGSHRSLLEGL